MGCLSTSALPPLLLFQLLSSIPCQSACTSGADDIKCLHSIKNSLIDRTGVFTTWKFGNSTPGFICRFLGVQCWHPYENTVLSINLPGLGLRGQFPPGLKYCRSLTDLDLSGNELSGTIPAGICNRAPYLATLDLSENEFTGSIPADLCNCAYLSVILLNNNKLSGEIPWQLSQLSRLKQLDVGDNGLRGPIPKFQNITDLILRPNNPGLCGPPLEIDCKTSSPSRPINPSVVAAFVLYGLVAIFWLGFALQLWISRSCSGRNPQIASSKETELANWANRIRTNRSAKVCLFEKPITKMTLADIEKATHNFSEENVIWSGRTGTLYKAWMPDGSLLAVKRLRAYSRTAKEFKSEMSTVAHLRHRNLLPLLGYCDVADQEKLLVYKYMANGSLLKCLHGVYSEQSLKWATRLKISIGIARGLAWLHHSCNPGVIHRNICSGIVFLDEEYEPRLGGFGLARLMNAEENHLSISGDDDNWEEEFGYDAPEEWRNPCVATLKGDVYRFGVLLLELITGVRPVHPIVVEEGTKELNLVEWIRDLLSKVERAEEAIHNYVELRRTLAEEEKGENATKLMVELMRLGTKCVSYNPQERPSMYSVYQSLREIGSRHAPLDGDEEL